MENPSATPTPGGAEASASALWDPQVERAAAHGAHRRAGGGANVATRERGLSLVAGGGLLALAARRHGWTRALAAGAGALLVARGATGRCAVYRALGVSTAGRAAARDVDVARAITIQASPEALADFCSDAARVRQVLRVVDELVELEPGRWRVTAALPRLGRRTWHVAVVQEGPHVEWRSERGAPVDHVVRLAFAPAPRDRGTELLASVAIGAPEGAAARLAVGLLAGAAERALGHELHRLKQLVETGEIATASRQPTGRRGAARRAIESAIGARQEARA